MSKTKRNQSNAVILASEAPQVTDVMQALKDRLANLQALTESNYKTGNTVPEGFPCAVKDETKVENLLMLDSYLVSKEKAYAVSQAKYKVTTAPAFNEGGHSVIDFEHDIQLRINIINHKEEKDRLETLLTKTQSFLTEKDKFALLLKDVEAALS